MSQKNKLAAVLSLSWITYMAAYLCRVNLSTVLEKLSIGIDISMELLGTASSVYFVVYASGQLLNGVIGDRVDPDRFIVAALAATGGINVMLGIQKSPALFVVLWGLNGFAQSMFWGTLLRLLSMHADESQRKNVSSLMAISSVVGYLISWVVLGRVFEPFGHVPYFAVPGAVALMLIPFWLVLSKRAPYENSPAQQAETPPLPAVLGEFLNDRLWHVCLLCMVVGATQEGVIFWLPMIFTSVLDLGENSLLLLSLIPIAKFAGIFLARAVLEKAGDSMRRASIITLSMSLVTAVLLVLTRKNTSVLTAVLIALLIVASNATNFYTVAYLPLYFAPRKIVATLVGAFDFSNYMGAAIISGELGSLMLRHGWQVLPMIWLGLILISLLLAVGGAGECLDRKGVRR